MFYIYSKFCILHIKQSAIAQDIECVGFYQKVWGSIPWSAKKFKDSYVCGNKKEQNYFKILTKWPTQRADVSRKCKIKRVPPLP